MFLKDQFVNHVWFFRILYLVHGKKILDPKTMMIKIWFIVYICCYSAVVFWKQFSFWDPWLEKVWETLQESWILVICQIQKIQKYSSSRHRFGSIQHWKITYQEVFSFDVHVFVDVASNQILLKHINWTFSHLNKQRGRP